MKSLEVEGARAPVPHSWRRHWMFAYTLPVPTTLSYFHETALLWAGLYGCTEDTRRSCRTLITSLIDRQMSPTLNVWRLQ